MRASLSVSGLEPSCALAASKMPGREATGVKVVRMLTGCQPRNFAFTLAKILSTIELISLVALGGRIRRFGIDYFFGPYFSAAATISATAAFCCSSHSLIVSFTTFCCCAYSLRRLGGRLDASPLDRVLIAWSRPLD